MKSIHRYTDLGATQLAARTSYILDTRNRLTNIEHRDGAGERFAYYTFAYDEANRLTSEERNTTTRNFVHDEANQLITDGPIGHSYDGTGNRLDTGYDTLPNTANQLRQSPVAGGGLWTYTYDFEGNLEKKTRGMAAETWTYAYDHSNQLTRVEKHETDGGPLLRRVDFKYDAFGQRIEKVVDSTTTRFAYDGENVFADFATDSSLTTRYLRGDVIDQIFARVGAPGMAGELNWLLTDRLGSVHNVLGASGTILATLVYDGFGNITTESDPTKTGRYTWTGRERDVEIDLQYNRARYYDPATGRWIHRDPLGFDAGDSNLYRYVNNGPTNGTDPSGLDWNVEYQRLLKEGSLPIMKNGQRMTEEQYRTWYEFKGPGGTSNDFTRRESPPPSPSSKMPPNGAASLQGQLQLLSRQLLPSQPVPQASPTKKALIAEAEDEVYEVVLVFNGKQSKGVDSDGKKVVGAGKLATFRKEYAAEDLIALGRSLGDEVVVIYDDLVTQMQYKLIRLGQLQASGKLPYYPNGYVDAFGSHKSFCMSCHDPAHPGAQLKMELAMASPEVFFGKLTAEVATLLLPVGVEYVALRQVATAGARSISAAERIALEAMRPTAPHALRTGAWTLADAGATAHLSRRANQLHSVLDPIAQTRRTTAVLQTTSGARIAGGGKRDLEPIQRAINNAGEILAKLPGQDAEITVLMQASRQGARPRAIATTRDICPDCRRALEEAGATITGPRTAIWR